MKLSGQYTLQTLNGVPYLLPFGQSIAQNRRGIRLNETGLFLLDKLKEGLKKEELLSAMATHYEAEEDDIPVLKQDLDSFLSQLVLIGILEKEDVCLKPNCYFCIGGLTIGYSGTPDFLPSSMLDFSCQEPSNEEKADQYITISSVLPNHFFTGSLLIKTDELEICLDDTDYVFTFSQQTGVPVFRISRNGSHVRIYINPDAKTEQIREELFFSIRDAFLFMAQQHQLFALHSASLLYRDRVWLFSGPSGTGKSTHTNLWNRLFQTPLINGDLNLCKVTKNAAVVYGMPWCGTSGIYTKKKYPLGGIILLRQAKENRIEELSADEKQLFVSQRLISPSWTQELFLKNLRFAEYVEKREIPVFRLHCNMEDLAAQTAKDYIDHIIR